MNPAFDPTPAPRGRLARLGVVLHVSSPAEQHVALAAMCERAGIEVVWFMDRIGGPRPPEDDDAWLRAAAVSPRMSRSGIGAMVDLANRPPTVLAAAAATVYGPGLPTLELGVLSYGPATMGYLADLREALMTHLPERRPRLSGVAMDVGEIGALLEIVDDLVLPGWRFTDLEAAADEARAEASEAGRDPSSLGVAVLVPVSIGRTGAEASARADGDPLFSHLGHPAEVGIFGTLEECQDRVIALAHAGVTDVRCILPAAPDVHDVIAQLTAMTVGTTDVLRPGSLRSPAPPPPVGWGGRPDRPPQPGISGGSKRR
ncbi:MAG: LLM class flavin-dependent oxidoreductase [Chloroflexota bacterium]